MSPKLWHLFFHLLGNSKTHTPMELLYWFTKPASVRIPLTKYKSYSVRILFNMLSSVRVLTTQ